MGIIITLYYIAVHRLRKLFRTPSRADRVAAKRAIHFIYFLCWKDFNCFMLSFESLKRLGGEHSIGDIYVYTDPDDPIPAHAAANLKRKGITVKASRYSLKRGITRVLAELEAFLAVAERVSCDGVIAKADSDVLFLNPGILDRALRMDYDILGQMENESAPYIYIQGGLYFISLRIAQKIARGNILKAVVEVSRLIKNRGRVYREIPEDAVITKLVELSKGELKYEDIYVPIEDAISGRGLKDSALGAAHFQESIIRERYSKINFMRKCADQLGLKR